MGEWVDLNVSVFGGGRVRICVFRLDLYMYVLGMAEIIGGLYDVEC